MFQRPQGGRQIAAVHSGDEQRIKRLQSLGVVPIEKMAGMTRQPLKNIERIRRLADKLMDGQIPEIVCRQPRVQQKTEVGR